MEKFTITPQTAPNIQIHEEFETFQMLSDGTWSYRKFKTDGEMLFIFNTSGPVTVLNIEIRSYDLDNHADHPSPTDEQREMIREAVRSIPETI